MRWRAADRPGHTVALLAHLPVFGVIGALIWIAEWIGAEFLLPRPTKCDSHQQPRYGPGAPPLTEAPDRAEQETDPQGDRKRCERTLTNRVLERAHLRLDLAKGFAAGHAEKVRHLSRQPGNVVPHRLRSPWMSSIVPVALATERC